MSKALFTAAIYLGLLHLAVGPTYAQDQAKPEDLIIRPGDKIEWVAPSPHRLRIGGPGLTSLENVKKILSFSPALNPKPGDIMEGEANKPVTGTVLDDAATKNVKDFVFTCGQHPTDMKSLSFRIEPKKAADQKPRTLRISAAPGLKWILVTEDGRKVQVDTTP